MANNLIKRLIVAAVGIPALIFIIYKGELFLFALCLLVALLGSWELAAMLLSKKIIVGKKLMTLLVIATVTVFQFSTFAYSGLLIMYVLFSLAALFKMAETGVVEYTSRLSIAMLTAVYPGFFISFAILIRREFVDFGWIILLFIFVNSWIADTFAYGFGRWLGKRKLAPRISPKKTWAGFVFSFPGGMLAAIAAYYYLDGQLGLPILISASFIATLFGQIGDLVESAIKRDCDVKDSSNLIPGHGGVLDRFDSLLFALPAVYFTFKMFG
ncbi:MAG: phosphatidate cytidylyltransferase [candidate division Zixibacteria bacterium]